MMITRRVTLAALVLGLSGFSGCTSNPDASFLEKVQELVMNACGFVPLIATILAILALHDSNLQTAQQIADAICNVLNAARARGVAPAIKGVPIQGRYVR